MCYCGKPNNKPTIWEWIVAPIYADSGGALLGLPHSFEKICEVFLGDVNTFLNLNIVWQHEIIDSPPARFEAPLPVASLKLGIAAKTGTLFDLGISWGWGSLNPIAKMRSVTNTGDFTSKNGWIIPLRKPWFSIGSVHNQFSM